MRAVLHRRLHARRRNRFDADKVRTLRAVAPADPTRDGAEESAVVRAAMAAGVPDAVVLEELQREVERRLMRSQRFYDEREW